MCQKRSKVKEYLLFLLLENLVTYDMGKVLINILAASGNPVTLNLILQSVQLVHNGNLVPCPQKLKPHVMR